MAEQTVKVRIAVALDAQGRICASVLENDMRVFRRIIRGETHGLIMFEATAELTIPSEVPARVESEVANPTASVSQP